MGTSGNSLRRAACISSCVGYRSPVGGGTSVDDRRVFGQELCTVAPSLRCSGIRPGFGGNHKPVGYPLRGRSDDSAAGTFVAFARRCPSVSLRIRNVWRVSGTAVRQRESAHRSRIERSERHRSRGHAQSLERVQYGVLELLHRGSGGRRVRPRDGFRCGVCPSRHFRGDVEFYVQSHRPISCGVPRDFRGPMLPRCLGYSPSLHAGGIRSWWTGNRSPDRRVYLEQRHLHDDGGIQQQRARLNGSGRHHRGVRVRSGSRDGDRRGRIGIECDRISERLPPHRRDRAASSRSGCRRVWSTHSAPSSDEGTASDDAGPAARVSQGFALDRGIHWRARSRRSPSRVSELARDVMDGWPSQRGTSRPPSWESL